MGGPLEAAVSRKKRVLVSRCARGEARRGEGDREREEL